MRETVEENISFCIFSITFVLLFEQEALACSFCAKPKSTNYVAGPE